MIPRDRINVGETSVIGNIASIRGNAALRSLSERSGHANEPVICLSLERMIGSKPFRQR